MTGEYLIAMKLKSGRQYKNDLSDIVGILAEHKKQEYPITKEAISKAVTNLYGGWSKIDKKSVAYIDSILDNQNYEEMYAAIRENEQNTKSVLIAFQNEYPGMLTEGNIDSVIENFGKSSESKVAVRERLEMLKNQQTTKKQKPKKNDAK